MNKAAFLSTLRQHLDSLPAPEVEDILSDQEEYFRDAMSSGRTEEEAVRSLGDPKVFAANLKAELKIQKAEKSETLPKQVSQTAGALFAILALAPMNLIFVLGPFIALLGVLIAGWAIAFSAFVTAMAGFWAFFAAMLVVSVGIWTHISAFFLIVAVTGASVLGLLLMYKITQYFVLGTLAYLHWNLRFIKGRA